MNMKRIFIIAICVIAWVNGFAQANDSIPQTVEMCKVNNGKVVSMFNLKIEETTGDASYVIEYDDKAEVLWKWCRMWLAENVKQYNQIKQIEDKAEGMLMVNFTMPLKVEGIMMDKQARWIGSQTWKMTIQCKEGRLRVKLTEYKTDWTLDVMSSKFGWMKMHTREGYDFNSNLSNIGWENLAKPYRNAIENTIFSLSRYIKKMAENDDDF